MGPLNCAENDILRTAGVPERVGEPRKLAARAELLESVLRKMFGWILELDFRPTTRRRSDKFILAVTSLLLSPVYNRINNKVDVIKHFCQKMTYTDK